MSNSFRTEIKIQPGKPIDHSHRIVTMGSCFSDNIGQRLSDHKFTTFINPLGTSYNPVSIHESIQMAFDGLRRDGVVESKDGFRHFDFHSKFVASSPVTLTDTLEQELQSFRESLKVADVLIITYGTGWVYRHNTLDRIVSNCQKVPSTQFQKKLLTLEDIVHSFQKVKERLHKQNPRLRIVLTLSPVRHLKDTMELNQVSKSLVRAALYEITSNLSDVEYFPAYEIVMDDLRDYRFYESDMIHPNALAIDYIWQKFGETYFSADVMALNERWTKVRRALLHRPFLPGSEPHRRFLESTLVELGELKRHLDVSKEIREVEEQLR